MVEGTQALDLDMLALPVASISFRASWKISTDFN